MMTGVCSLCLPTVQVHYAVQSSADLLVQAGKLAFTACLLPGKASLQLFRVRHSCVF